MGLWSNILRKIRVIFFTWVVGTQVLNGLWFFYTLYVLNTIKKKIYSGLHVGVLDTGILLCARSSTYMTSLRTSFTYSSEVIQSLNKQSCSLTLKWHWNFKWHLTSWCLPKSLIIFCSNNFGCFCVLRACSLNVLQAALPQIFNSPGLMLKRSVQTPPSGVSCSLSMSSQLIRASLIIILQRVDSLEKTLMLGRTGGRRWGQQRMR